MRRERRTVEAMVRIYCRDHHQVPIGLCTDCQGLVDYAFARLERCPYQENKPTCANCPIHCYKPEMRAKARAVMRYAGPRMMYRHPILSVRHLLDGRREAPARPRRESAGATPEHKSGSQTL